MADKQTCFVPPPRTAIEPHLGTLDRRGEPTVYRWEVRAADGTVEQHGEWVKTAVRAVRLGSTAASRQASKAEGDSLFAAPDAPTVADVETSLL